MQNLTVSMTNPSKKDIAALKSVKEQYENVIKLAPKFDVSETENTTTFAFDTKTGIIYEAEATVAILIFNDCEKVIANKDNIIVITTDKGIGAQASDEQLRKALKAAKAA